MTAVAAEDRHVWGDDTQLGVSSVGHGSRSRNHAVSVSEDGEVWTADVVCIAVAVICCSCTAARTCVQGKEEAEVNSCLGYECILLILKADRLRCAARSKRSRHVEDVVLAGEVVDVDHLSALIYQRDVVHYVAVVAARGLNVAGVVSPPSALIAGLCGVEWARAAVHLHAVYDAVTVGVFACWIESELFLSAVVEAIAVPIEGRVAGGFADAWSRVRIVGPLFCGAAKREQCRWDENGVDVLHEVTLGLEARVTQVSGL